MRVAINGRFLVARPTGVQRFAREVTKRVLEREDAVLLGPRNAPPQALGAPVRRGALRGPLWEQVELPSAATRAGAAVVLNLANSAPAWGGPHVQVLHDLTPITRPHDFRLAYRFWVRWAHVRSARRARVLATVSATSAERIAAVLGRGSEAITVVRQGVSPFDAPAAPDDVDAVRERFGLPARYHLALGSTDPRKGADFVRGVFTAWSETEPDAPALALVGGAYGHVHRGRERGGERHLGHVTDEELRALYTGAEAFLFPSAEEGFGRPPLEALACGTRVVVAPYAAAEEVLDRHADVVPQRAELWLNALRGVALESAAERARRVEAGRAWACSYSWDEAVDTLIAACAGASDTRAEKGAS